MLFHTDQLKKCPDYRLSFQEELCLSSDYDVGPDPVSICFSGEIRKQAEIIELSGVLKTVIPLVCSKCLKVTAFPLELSVCEYFLSTDDSYTKPDTEDISKFRDVTTERQEFISVEEGILDITAVLESLIYLHLPLKVLCSNNCKGLCPVCGADRNEKNCSCRQSFGHPAFDVLSTLLQDKEV